MLVGSKNGVPSEIRDDETWRASVDVLWDKLITCASDNQVIWAQENSIGHHD